jgi:pyruvate/2-oxoglutarate dehydrogenase complex dihydrolipoamide dehydrogenase (E3) component
LIAFQEVREITIEQHQIFLELRAYTEQTTVFGMSKYDYDLIVIGGGAAGLSLASIASRLGVKVALIDAGSLGGDCLHYGCVPSKTLIHAANVAHTARSGGDIGVHAKNVSVDFPAVISRIQTVIQTIQDHADSPERFREMGCDVWVNTKAFFVDSRTVDIGEKRITGKKIVICTGTRPSTLALPGLEEAGYLTNETVFKLSSQPKSLIVIGSGPIGCELAQAFQRLGTQVTLLNRSDRILGKEDPAVQQFMREQFTAEGIEIFTGIEMQKAELGGENKTITFIKDGQENTVSAEEILVAVGRQSNADTLQLENAGVKMTEKGYVLTNNRLQTSQKHIYAAGDASGHMQFTHSAGYEAGVVVSNALLHIPKSINTDLIPWTTFTDPEVASCGINEETAKKKSIAYTVSTFPLSHQDRALAENTASGFITLILGKKDKILGVQIVGPHAGELIHEWILARNFGIKLSKISGMVHVYPTLAGANQQAAGEYLGGKFFTPKTRKWVRRIFGYKNTRIDDI